MIESTATEARRYRLASCFVSLCFALGVVGCSAVETSGTETSSSEQATTSTRDQSEVEADYLAVLRAWSDDQESTTVIDVATDEELVNLGRAACDELNEGVTVEALRSATFEQFDRIEATLDDLEAIFVAAVGSFCPEHLDKFH